MALAPNIIENFKVDLPAPRASDQRTELNLWSQEILVYFGRILFTFEKIFIYF